VPKLSQLIELLSPQKRNSISEGRARVVAIDVAKRPKAVDE
jgi:hypothetical protein